MAAALIAFGGLVFAILLVAFALRASRSKGAEVKAGAVSGGETFLLYGADGGTANPAADSACVASHGADCGPVH